MVTGAGGSIGSELCRQLHRLHPGRLIMLDRDESALHAIELDLHGRALLDSDDTVLADIRDPRRIRQVFADYQPRDRVPRRGAQAPAAAGALPGRGAQDERLGHAQRAARGPRQRGQLLRQHLHRQGGRPGQRARLLQARGRAADRAHGPRRPAAPT